MGVDPPPGVTHAEAPLCSGGEEFAQYPPLRARLWTMELPERLHEVSEQTWPTERAWAAGSTYVDATSPVSRPMSKSQGYLSPVVCSPCFSLASDLSPFSPPAPGAAQLRAAAIAHAGAEVSVLVDTARRAAAIYPACAPLAEALAEAATRELQCLQREEEAVRSDSPRESTTTTYTSAPLPLRIAEARSATAQGLLFLHAALDGTETHRKLQSEMPTLQEERQMPRRRSPSALARPQPELRHLFGDVAADMQQAIDRIRAERRSVASSSG